MNGSEARAVVESAVRREIFGPIHGDEPLGSPIDCSTGSVRFESLEASRGQFHEANTFEEILTQTDPLRRYGVGILHSGAAHKGTAIESADSVNRVAEDLDITWLQGITQHEGGPNEPPVEVNGVNNHDQVDSDDFDLTDANNFKPSAMAISFKCRVGGEGSVTIKVNGASYEKIKAYLPGSQPRDWWLRKPFELRGNITARVLLEENNHLKNIQMHASGSNVRSTPTTQIFSRIVPGDNDPLLRLVTIAVVNN